MNHITAVRDYDLGLAITRCDDARKGCWDARVCCACVAGKGLDQGGEGAGAAVVEVCGDRQDFVASGGGERDPEVSAVGWVCGDEGCSEEGGEEESRCGERLPDGRKGVNRRHLDCGRLGLELRLLKLNFRGSKIVVQTDFWGKTKCLIY